MSHGDDDGNWFTDCGDSNLPLVSLHYFRKMHGSAFDFLESL